MPEGLWQRLCHYPRIVFDLDGTLYDVRDFERPALAEVAEMLRKKSGLELPGIETVMWAMREADRHAPGLFDKTLVASGLPLDWVGECVCRMRAHRAEGLRAVPSLGPLLTRLRANGSRLALVSNGRPELQAGKLQALGLESMFDRSIYCHPDRPQELKPGPWAWDALKDWRGDADTVYVGDDAVDEAFARTGRADYVYFLFRNPVYGD